MRGEELLLLADRTQESERMNAEPDDAEREQREQREGSAAGRTAALARAAGAEHEEGQHEPGAELHADAGRDCGRAGAEVGPRRRSRGQRPRQREHDQRVVVRAAEPHHEQHRIEPDERGGPARGVPEARAGARQQGDRAEARECGERFQQPEPGGESERRREIAREREQRTVGRVLELPAQEPVHMVAGCFGGEVGVGVEAVEGAHAGERQVAEDVL